MCVMCLRRGCLQFVTCVRVPNIYICGAYLHVIICVHSTHTHTHTISRYYTNLRNILHVYTIYIYIFRRRASVNKKTYFETAAAYGVVFATTKYLNAFPPVEIPTRPFIPNFDVDLFRRIIATIREIFTTFRHDNSYYVQEASARDKLYVVCVIAFDTVPAQRDFVHTPSRTINPLKRTARVRLPDDRSIIVVMRRFVYGFSMQFSILCCTDL